ncbi:MAG: hypothetical protein R3E12_14210 [Candidatus Eisenbacteria bacterium]
MVESDFSRSFPRATRPSRFQINAAHTEADVAEALAALREVRG